MDSSSTSTRSPSHGSTEITKVLFASTALARRLAIASEADGTVAVVTTQPGSKSQANSQRRGFELLYSRAVLVREP